MEVQIGVGDSTIEGFKEEIGVEKVSIWLE